MIHFFCVSNFPCNQTHFQHIINNPNSVHYFRLVYLLQLLNQSSFSLLSHMLLRSDRLISHWYIFKMFAALQSVIKVTHFLFDKKKKKKKKTAVLVIGPIALVPYKKQCTLMWVPSTLVHRNGLVKFKRRFVWIYLFFLHAWPQDIPKCQSWG